MDTILSASLGKRLRYPLASVANSTYIYVHTAIRVWCPDAALGPSRPLSSRSRRARRARNLVCELNELLARQLKIELTCASGTTSTYNCIQ